MVMLVLPMGGGCCMGRNGWWLWAMHRLVVVLVVSSVRVPQGGDSTGDGVAADVSGEGVSGCRRWYRWRCQWWGCCRCCGAVRDATGDGVVGDVAGAADL